MIGQLPAFDIFGQTILKNVRHGTEAEQTFSELTWLLQTSSCFWLLVCLSGFANATTSVHILRPAELGQRSGFEMWMSGASAYFPLRLLFWQQLLCSTPFGTMVDSVDLVDGRHGRFGVLVAKMKSGSPLPLLLLQQRQQSRSKQDIT